MGFNYYCSCELVFVLLYFCNHFAEEESAGGITLVMWLLVLCACMSLPHGAAPQYFVSTFYALIKNSSDKPADYVGSFLMLH